MADNKFDYCEKIRLGYDASHYTEITGIAYYADRMSTPHSDGEVEPIEVINTVNPIGVSGRHKQWDIVIGLDSDNYEAFYTQQVQTGVAGSRAIKDNADNDEIGYLCVYLKDATGATITRTFTTLKIAVMAVSARFSNEPNMEYQVTEYRLTCWGTRTVA